mmetsp:Transcript_30538/g.60435  ORF Transcript_30538/g.60435 Transcript_30538/m.60435 type:complete len:95 (-) Transcript_30538:897-1181(-)
MGISSLCRLVGGGSLSIEIGTRDNQRAGFHPGLGGDPTDNCGAFFFIACNFKKTQELDFKKLSSNPYLRSSRPTDAPTGARTPSPPNVRQKMQA